MRTRDQQRIFKRFMAGESIFSIWNPAKMTSLSEIEQAIRDQKSRFAGEGEK